MDKKKRLLEIITELQELYPHLDRLMITDLEDPESIIITSESRIEQIAEEMGLDFDSIEELEDFDEEISEEDLDQLALLTFGDDDDDNGGGMLQ